MLIHVSDRCIRCGRCKAVCPTSIIEMTDSKPFIEERDEGRCIVCGHCVAVCPEEALDHRLAPLKEQTKMKKIPAAGPKKTRTLLRSVRSVCVYKKDEVDRKVVTRIADTARFAPTGLNSQDVTFLAVMERETVQELSRRTMEWMRKASASGAKWSLPYGKLLSEEKNAKRDLVFRGAPHVLIALADSSSPYGTDNACMAMVYARIQATAMDIGTCRAGFFEQYARAEPREVAALLRLPEKRIVGAAVMLGYAKYTYRRLPDRDPLRIEFI